MERIFFKPSPQIELEKVFHFVPQTKNVFSGMSVEENLEMGAYLRDDNYQEIIEEIYELFPILREKEAISWWAIPESKTQVALGRALW